MNKINSIPEPPIELTDIAKKEWVRLTTELFNAGMLSGIDLTLLELCCVTYDKLISSKTSNDYCKYANIWKLLACQMGITPLARVKIPQPKTTNLSDKEYFN